MSRYTGPRLRLVRALGPLPGLIQKEPKRTTPPGQHGAQRSKKKSDFGLQLLEKQKVAVNYGVTERQLRNLFRRVSKKKGRVGADMLISLEMRMDNVAFRMGFARSIQAARQLVRHGHLLLDGKKVNLPGIELKPSQKISVRDSEKSRTLVRASLVAPAAMLPSHLALAQESLTGTVNARCTREEVLLPVDEAKVVGFYSRR